VHVSRPAGYVPIDAEPASGQRSHFARADAPYEGTSPCLRCADAPCMNWSPEEVTRTVAVPAPVSLDPRVCPTDALHWGVDDIPYVDDDACVGCGLCVARCPVGAIRLDPETGGAVVDSRRAVLPVRDREEFEQFRRAVSDSQAPESRPADDAHRVEVQLQRWLRTPAGRDSGALRLMVRNAFLLTGDAARLRNDGDVHAWAEVAAGRDATVGVVQVEDQSDTLDPFRRVLASSARVVAAQGVDVRDVVPVVALLGLPNARVDYYRVVADASRYLGVEVRTLTLAYMLLAVRLPPASLLREIQADMQVRDGSESLMPALRELFGLGVPVYGAAPAK